MAYVTITENYARKLAKAQQQRARQKPQRCLHCAKTRRANRRDSNLYYMGVCLNCWKRLLPGFSRRGRLAFLREAEASHWWQKNSRRSPSTQQRSMMLTSTEQRENGSSG